MRSIVLAACLGAIVASSALADIPAPPNVERRETTHRFRFVGTEDYHDYVFLFGFFSASGKGNPFAEPARMIFVKEAQPHASSGYHLAGDHLLAIPRGEFDARKEQLLRQQGPYALLTASVPGTLKCDLRPAVGNASAEYRVHIKDEKLTVELLSDPSIFTVPPTPAAPAPVSPAPARRESAIAQPSKLMPWVFSAVACVALSISLALGGIWLAWRYGRKADS